ncbi:O-antigen ligase family protein [Pseudomonas sp. ZM23]|uniref:O-antigen ligase family protein n=1 Tax=Pseudomonas triclosanedens TaxID=2961893 RepID=A0ABY6ZSA0_9PSED|nr:O-antigen ligase family protein [Pseudomonas triclosanedens]MCP8467247.1 O-antigen ligase family protein [Pseudomonas triclosanedens]MCP8472574.1 O-antigen ligase family protein [Pseudomonas triclosanedens]MCP8478635.1 O-antigen ligase family protein [Pseudomonas triclosanedens]WAI47809.1 O-antigen ligase family protein [Pseudomonas triclosanedens]
MICLLVGRFWWPTESGNWEKTLRLLCGLSLLVLTVQLFRERARLLSATFVVFVLFWVGLQANAIAADSYSSVRQLLLLLVFTLMVMVLGGQDSRTWRIVLGIGVLSGAGFAGFSLVHKVLTGEFALGYRVMGLHNSGVPGVADFGITIEAGMHYAFSFVVGVWLLLRSRKPALVSLWIVCVLVLGVYLYFTFSRAAWVAALAGAVLLVLSVARGRMRLAAFAVLALGALAAVVGGYRQLAYEFGSRGLTYRDEVWRAVFDRVGENWWFGHGAHTELGEVVLSTGQVVHNPHSLYLEVLYQFGVFGLASMIIVLAVCLWALWRSSAPLARLWFALLASASVVFAVELHFFVAAPNVVWMWFWLPLAGALAATTSPPSASRPQAPGQSMLGAQPA